MQHWQAELPSRLKRWFRWILNSWKTCGCKGHFILRFQWTHVACVNLFKVEAYKKNCGQKATSPWQLNRGRALHQVCQLSGLQGCTLQKQSLHKGQNFWKPYLVKQHGFISTRTSLSMYALDSDEQEKWQSYNARRRKQPGQANTAREQIWRPTPGWGHGTLCTKVGTEECRLTP